MATSSSLRRKNGIAGAAVPVESAGRTDPEFLAHYFFRGKRNSLGNVTGFEECTILLTTSSFELIGNHVFDNSEEGELFIGPAAPKLSPSTAVVWARIGEEKKDGWKGENFKPTERSLPDVLKDRQGRFFVRVYDNSK